MLAALGVMAAFAAAPASESAGCAAICQPERLRPFLARLAEPPGAATRPLHILLIGDSHSAGDLISNVWRRRVQAWRGFGGRGALAPGRPYAGYLTWGVTASQSPDWSVDATFGPNHHDGGARLGASGFTLTARAAGARLGVSADTPEQRFDRLTLCALVGPGAGAVDLALGDATYRWSLSAPAPGADCRTLDSATPADSATIVTEDMRPVSITSVATFARGNGAVLSNLGVVGSQLVHFGRTDEAVLRAELAAWRPDLIVLEFGTNEAFSPSFDPIAYETGLRAQIARLRRIAGAATPVLLIGSPDVATNRPELIEPSAGCGENWGPPRALAEVRRRQARVARDLGLGFWDWAEAMGGRCAAMAWVRDGRMRGDHVHFTAAGAERIGAMIDAELTIAAATVALAGAP